MESKLLQQDDIPWETISLLGKLTCLMYDFMKNWDFKKLDNLNSFLESEENNCDLCDNDVKILKDLKSKYPNGEIVKFFTNSTDLQCAVCKTPGQKKFAIVFRGSESALDWIYDLMIWQVKFQYGNKTFGNIHSGFYNQIMKDNFFSKLCRLVEEQIATYPDYEWEITGHSAGGAHSIITGFLLAQCFEHKHFTVSSLAAPKIGDTTFTELFEKTTNLTHYRVCYNRDVITSVPTFGYYHTGVCLLYVNDKWDVNSKYPFYIYRCWSVRDHSVDLYVKALEAELE